MTEEIKAIRDDIAFLRALAEEGRQTPMLGGGVLVAAGTIFGLASLAHWATVAGLLAAQPIAPLVIWPGAGVIFAIVARTVLRQSRGKVGAKASVNRTTSAAWSAVGWTILAIWMALMAMSYRTGNWAVMEVFPIIILALYGAAWAVAAAMTRKGWMRLTAGGCFTAAIVMGLLAGTPHMLLAHATGLALFAVVPGLALMRQEPPEMSGRKGLQGADGQFRD